MNICSYSQALRISTTENHIEILKRNRSLAYLNTKHFDAALNDTGFPHFGSPASDKALFRAAQALYWLGRFEKCYEVLELLRRIYPDNKQALVVLDRARDRCQEQKSGVYNFKHLQAQARSLRPPHLDHATYLGPIRIQQTESKGRGLFVTEAVKAGDLLLCEKAFSHAFANEASPSTNLLMNTETNRAFMGTQADLIRIVVHKLHRNPSLAPSFTKLHHGNYEGVSTPVVDQQAIVDT